MTDLVVSGQFVEVIRASVASLRVSSVFIEVLRSSTTSPLRINGIFMEVLRSSMIPPPVASSGDLQTYVSIING